jgi:hypothetical protein
MQSLGLSLASWDGAGWTVEQLYESEDLDRYWATSLAFDARQDPYIACTVDDWDSEVSVVHPLRTDWVRDTIDIGHGPSLATNAAGELFLAYSSADPRGLKLARLEAGSWLVEAVEEGADWVSQAAVAIDAQGEPAIGYAVEGSAQWLRYASHDALGWSIEDVMAVGTGEPVSLAFDPAGNPGLVVYGTDGSSPNSLKYAARIGGDWEFELVDSQSSCRTGHRSLGYDSDGNPLIVYRACLSLAVASPFGPATLLRGASQLGAGWKEAALPLTSWNDDETAPFPVATTSPGALEDTDVPGGPLVLYRMLWSGDRPARNSLRLVKQPAAVGLSY